MHDEDRRTVRRRLHAEPDGLLALRASRDHLEARGAAQRRQCLARPREVGARRRDDHVADGRVAKEVAHGERQNGRRAELQELLGRTMAESPADAARGYDDGDVTHGPARHPATA